ncbi:MULTISPECIES: MFS transporter [Arenibacter]|jgi:MFS family permease|uniref:MFS transporter n=1 Tax=Arenibacter TaxID=178469 RepID=UPI0004DFBC2C|nr:MULTISPECIES: MFS transporter [Arenibacter]GBF20108.1 hexuronate transporter [Arenibacter sp. NBRC 103722]|tara:strand:+ start:12551 stop:13819 length:1269 start_codon:yes stop_codon:yes gene_type:complete|eukprot:TRINITY_DN5636_c0_g2_i1.p1 TRINITY_DN5636_c0_g2~~TRINITY_DN5636_c0_g2_i1.p1  ORF type:complete len:423 (-),score=62.70 TRINITY_DN5636_c0_g2_i1:917-2185(-)
MEKSNDQQKTNANRLFYGSCFALITTAFSFSIRAGILPQLGEELSLSAEQLGFINSMWFFGFPISMVIGGLIYHKVGGKAIMQFAFFAHALGIILTIYSGSYVGLLISTLLIGLGNGCTEAACNPMIADAYSGTRMSRMMNRFHMWFPGGIVIGSLVSKFMTDAGLSWETQIWVIMIPTLIYAYLYFGQSWPKAKIEAAATLSGNLKAMVSPLFIFMIICMSLTAISEFGPQQWVGLILAKSGAEPMIILALVTGLMAVARYFGGEVVHKFDQTGVLLGSAVLATIGIYLFSTQTGTMAYVAAIFFALGIAYFWPNMIGFIADKIPKSGALGMSIIGAVGMFSSSIFQPIIGGWIDSDKAEAAAAGFTGDELELVSGQATLGTMVAFPAILIVLFTILWFWVKKRKNTDAAEATSGQPVTDY